MRKNLFQYLIFFLITASGFVSEEKDILKYVNTTIGTEDGGGATFIGACTPHGMVKLGPQTSLYRTNLEYKIALWTYQLDFPKFRAISNKQSNLIINNNLQRENYL